MIPLVKIVFVKAPIDQAFHRFTAELGTWWPLASHSVGEGRSDGVTMEGRVGGRIVERMQNGDTSVWGTLTAWEPPRRVAFTWHPGREPESAQDVEVRFESAEGGARIRWAGSTCWASTPGDGIRRCAWWSGSPGY